MTCPKDKAGGPEVAGDLKTLAQALNNLTKALKDEARRLLKIFEKAAAKCINYVAFFIRAYSHRLWIWTQQKEQEAKIKAYLRDQALEAKFKPDITARGPGEGKSMEQAARDLGKAGLIFKQVREEALHAQARPQALQTPRQDGTWRWPPEETEYIIQIWRRK